MPNKIDYYGNLVKGLSKLLKVEDTSNSEIAYVNSEAIDSIEYNKVAETMDITFNSGSTYTYFQVSESTFENLVESSSVGRKFVRTIRDNYVFIRTG